MLLRATLLSALGCCIALVTAGTARAATLRVPQRYATIQAAVDAAAPGDHIRVGSGRYCGATLTKNVFLDGRGSARIIGCDTSPTINDRLRVGFYLPGVKGVNPASGSRIRGFIFDGEGVSNADLSPLAFGIFARFANDVVVQQNRFDGTVQAITNTGGDRWRIEHNRIGQLTVLDCTGYCTGGDGIVIALARGNIAADGGSEAAINRPEDNLIRKNRIEGSAPDGFGTFSLAGVLLLAADHTTVLSNQLLMRDNPNADAVGQGILVSNTCCGLPTAFLPGSRFTTLAFNDAHKSEVGILVEGSDGTNTQGLFLLKNRGTTAIEGTVQLAAAARRVLAPVRAQPTL